MVRYICLIMIVNEDLLDRIIDLLFKRGRGKRIRSITRVDYNASHLTSMIPQGLIVDSRIVLVDWILANTTASLD